MDIMLQNVEKKKKTKKEKDKKRKTKKKQNGVDIKPIILQDLMIEAKMVKQEIKEIKEDNSTDINEQNIAKKVNLTGFPTTEIIMTDPPLEKEISHDQEIDHNKLNKERICRTEDICHL